MRKHRLYLWSALLAVASYSCNTANSCFGKRTPHEKYLDRITSAGLDKTEMGRRWIAAAEQSFEETNRLSLPFRETGFFLADSPRAAAFAFDVQRGEKIFVSLEAKTLDSASVFAELWDVSNSRRKLIEAMESTKDTLIKTVKADGRFLVRLQPELLAPVEYTITITSGPSLAFPVDQSGHPKFISYWGASRDAGARKHEGVDIRAAFRTPALAAADGYIARVGDNRLGGKIVFLYNSDTGDNLYYAHLDSQTVQQGERVHTGDTIGLIGNTGNARNTVPHLHFGIYSRTGAVNPILFIRPADKKPLPVTASNENFNRWIHVTGPAKVHAAPENGPEKFSLDREFVAFVTGAAGKYYRILLPDGKDGYIAAGQISSKAVGQRKADTTVRILAVPEVDAPASAIISQGQEMVVLGRFYDYLLVSAEGLTGWVQTP